MLVVAAALVGAAALPATEALAAWTARGAVPVQATASRIPAGHRPSVAAGDSQGDAHSTGEDQSQHQSDTQHAITITWPPSYLVTGDEVAGYRVNRVPASGPPVQVCEAPAPVHTCRDVVTDQSPVTYTVTPIQASWKGPASPPSATIGGDGNAGDSHPSDGGARTDASPRPTATPAPTPSPTPTPTPRPTTRPSPSPSSGHD